MLAVLFSMKCLFLEFVDVGIAPLVLISEKGKDH